MNQLIEDLNKTNNIIISLEPLNKKNSKKNSELENYVL